jgi:hypothetical protein
MIFYYSSLFFKVLAPVAQFGAFDSKLPILYHRFDFLSSLNFVPQGSVSPQYFTSESLVKYYPTSLTWLFVTVLGRRLTVLVKWIHFTSADERSSSSGDILMNTAGLVAAICANSAHCTCHFRIKSALD